MEKTMTTTIMGSIALSLEARLHQKVGSDRLAMWCFEFLVGLNM